MTVETLGPRARRFELLDLLRLLCAASVLLFHYGAVAPYSGVLSSDFYLLPDVFVYGQFGVHIFFMISGFVITLSARGRGPIAFLWARFLRLYPAYWICCTITTLALLAFGPMHQTLWSPTWPQYVVNMTMLESFVGVPYADAAYWSLTTELRFYAIVAACLLVRVRIDALALVSAWLLACAVSPYAPAALGKAAMATFAPYFIIGILIQRLVENRQTLFKLALIAVALVLASRDIYQQHAIHAARHFYPYRPEIAVAIVCCGAILVGCCAFAASPSARATRALIAIGATTYPLYLLHCAVGFALMGRLQDRAPARLVAVGVTALVVITVVLISQLLEPRLRRFLQRIGKTVERRFASSRRPSPLATP